MDGSKRATAQPKELSLAAIQKLDLSPEVKQALVAVQSTLSDAYRDAFIEMTQAVARQAAALERIQTTLNLLVDSVAPQLKGQVPAVVRVAAEDEDADLASALVVADPIGAGYTMSQRALSDAVGVKQGDVSVLVKAFDLAEDPQCAVVVRQGKRPVVNYHPRAVERLRQLIAMPPKRISGNAASALKRARKQLGIAEPVPTKKSSRGK